MKAIEAKLATVVDESRIALNRGSLAGVQEGDSVALYRTVEVLDPDSGESLGSVDVKKLNLEVEIVQEKMCVAVVTDLFFADNEPTDLMSNILRPKRRKRVSLNPAKGDRRTVRVMVGDRATIHIETPEEVA
ncbi:FlgT C-terminal domain-containing protein [Streptomyces sp. CAI-85]|uniref:FlgT C-terminal domain-containing protein n=1 Tax=Streptomyces sp. CAI-85 TaxID=1472662 RepID=UPI00158747F4|nr:FlgT C-terminal domain-containing protein [Streptomyces sp. CAI-85]NUV62789.1 hypothetical protein [Streptomyces sp. CAI-85]